ncbi:MAG: hypothetical protein ABFD25_06155 [Clostridiaceae bacterium]
MKSSNRNLRVLLTLILTLAMMITMLAGCGNSPKASDSTGAAGATANTTAASGSAAATATTETNSEVDTSSPYGKYKKPVELSVLSLDFKGNIQFDSSNPERKSASENMWINAYSEYLNIKVDRRIAEDKTALNAVINTSMASGTLPDVMIVPKEMFYVLVENGVCADLKESYESYVGSYGKLLGECVSSSKDALKKGTADGKLLGFPDIQGAYNETEVLWIRQDWLDAVKMKLPATVDEMLDVARAFKKAKLGGEKTVGLGLHFATEPGSTSESVSLQTIMAPYGAVLGTWQKDQTGNYVYANTADAVKTGLIELQKLYAEGIIKSDFAVGNNKNFKEEVANGLVGMYYGASNEGNGGVKSNLLNDPKANWTVCRIPTLNGEIVPQYTNDAINNFYVVNKKYNHPEAIFKMLQLEMHMCKDATAEETAKYYMCPDNYPAWYLRVFKTFDAADNPLKLGVLINEGLSKKAEHIDPASDGAYQNVLQGLAGNREKYGYVLIYTVARPIVLDIYNNHRDMLVSAYDGPITKNMTLYQSTINEALKNAMLQVVMGADISVFDKAVKTWYSTGGQAITDDVNNYYKNQK